jgi:hypothetical protein
VEAFLEELLLLCSRSEEYTQFLLARMAEVAAPDPLPPARETTLRGGAFNSAVRELLSYYIALEEYYMEESVAKVGVHPWSEGSLGVAGCLVGWVSAVVCCCNPAASPQRLLSCKLRPLHCCSSHHRSPC